MRRERRAHLVLLATVAATVAVSAAWYGLGWQPVRESAAAATAAVAAARSTLHATEQQATRYESYRATAARTRDQLQQLSTALPSDDQTAQLLITLQETAAAEGVALVGTREMAATQSDRLAVQGVELQVRGQFFDLQHLLARLEDAVATRDDGVRARGRLVQIAAVELTSAAAAAETTLTAPSPTLTATVLLHTYTWRDQTPAPETGEAP